VIVQVETSPSPAARDRNNFAHFFVSTSCVSIVSNNFIGTLKARIMK
jgi:hypothetical protein